MNNLVKFNILFAAFCFIISVIILTSVALSKHGKEQRSRLFIYIIITNLVLLITSTAWFLLNGNPGMKSNFLLIVFECIKASCGPVMLILFTQLIIVVLKEKTVVSKYTMYAARTAIAVCVADLIVIIIEPSIFSHVLIGDSNQLIRPDWFIFSYAFTFVCMVINSGILVANRKCLVNRELLTFFAYILIPALGVILHMMVEGTPINMISITIAIVFYFAIIQNELSKRAHETDKSKRHVKKLERELVENEISVIQSQIKPHFLYNALSAIVQLCDENPAQAKKAATDFSAFLRSNMDSLNCSGLISVEKEMDHVKNYLSLEKAIYGKALEIIYIIEAGGFGVPPLTIQPIAENAVKHGIGKKEGGGSITISVSETEDVYIIAVTDDGAGYDVNEFPENLKQHVGIDNVRKRLALYGGTFELSTEWGKGTTAVINLPKGECGIQ